MSIIVISILAILGWTSIFKQTFTTKEGFKYVYADRLVKYFTL